MTVFKTIARLIRHRWLDHTDAARAIPPALAEQLRRRVAASEQRHTGEVRICVEGGLPTSYLWRHLRDRIPMTEIVRQRALMQFSKLRVWDTEHNNGVLIYLLLAEHAIEIVADRAMTRAVPQLTWDAIVRDMQQSFQQAAYAQGLEQALELVSELLVAHFPRSPADRTDAADNLPDAPVVQGRFTKDV